MEHLELNGEQLKAVKSIERAIKKANKLGVGLWDDYGLLTAYNANKINCPAPDDSRSFSLNNYRHVCYDLNIPFGSFSAGNADDELFFDEI